jgi:hypothetical protein
MKADAMNLHPKRPAKRALLSAALLLVAALIPLQAVADSCAMPCCAEVSCCEETTSPVEQPATLAGCADSCGMRSSTPSQQLPEAVSTASQTMKIEFETIAVSVATLRPGPPPRLPARSVELHHAVPGDAPLYLYNDTFLI